jgi:hypothetical protein
VRDLVVQRVEKTSGRISAKRLLPQARAAGYAGSARNFVGWSLRSRRIGVKVTIADVGREFGRRGRR